MEVPMSKESKESSSLYFDRDVVVNKFLFPEKQNTKFVLMGSGLLLCQFLKILNERKFPTPVVITHPYEEHTRDQALYDSYRFDSSSRLYQDVFEVAKNLSVKVLETRDVNSAEVIQFLDINDSNIAFSFGCRSIIKKIFLDRFKGLVLNSHASNLPWDRGGGAGTWRILNDEKYVYGLIHFVDEGIDTGDILIKERRHLKCSRPFPKDLLEETWDFSLEILNKFLDWIEAGKEFEARKQFNDQSAYFPRLYTEKHGAINWQWNTIFIESFVRAFGFPYPGAWTFVNNKKVYIGICEIPVQSPKFHPFLVGLIFRDYEDGSIEVATYDGSIIISYFREGNVKISPKQFCKIGDRLVTPTKYLDDAMSYKAKY